MRTRRGPLSSLTTRAVTAAFALLLVYSCASIGSPDGGRYDEEPPRVVATTPADKSTNVTSAKKVRIMFNEYVKIENASEKVIVSPPQTEQPELSTSGKGIVMKLLDTLRANTTYTIDFGDAIVDNNESNPMGNYTYSFSTGDHIDTLAIGGYVVRADNLEPVKGILVGLYRMDNRDSLAAVDSLLSDSTLSPTLSPVDTLLTHLRFERVSRTDADGCFSIKGVAEGRYRVYALADMDGNYRFTQKSEMIAFDTTLYSPSWKRDLRHDTVWVDSTHYERIVHTPYTHFLPDDIVLKAFLEDGQAHYKLKEQRPDPLQFTIFFTAPADTLPLLEGIGEDFAGRILPHPNPTYDTIQYWITDTALAYRDTLQMRLTFMETDTLGVLQPRTDTLSLVPKITRAKQVKDLEKQVDKWVKQQTKRLERYESKLKKFLEKYPDSTYAHPEVIDTARLSCPLYTPTINVAITPSGAISPLQNLRLASSEPLAFIDTSRISFTKMVDSVWVAVDYYLERDSLDPCVMKLYAEWQPNDRFKLETDSATFRSVYGWWASPIKREIRVNPLDTYGSLFLQIRRPAFATQPVATGDSLASPPRIIVQLIDRSEKLIREMEADANDRADFFFLTPGDVYLRCFIDMDGDGKWTTGEYASGRQPEPVYYFPSPFKIKAKWEMEQVWTPDAIETMRQKPKALTKQKSKKKATTAHERNVQRDKENQYGQANKKNNNK